VGDPKPTPAAVPGVVANPAKENWTLTVLKVAWPVIAFILVVVTVVIALGLPSRMGTWMAALPILAGIDAAMGAVAFGGPAIKRAQTAAQNGAGDGP
jgi:hypothetical protein